MIHNKVADGLLKKPTTFPPRILRTKFGYHWKQTAITYVTQVGWES
jgi:hypothetical protein